LEFVGGLGFSSASSLSNAVSWLTDGTDRLRYVATEDIKPLIKARRETSEEEYLAFMRPFLVQRVESPTSAFVGVGLGRKL